MRNSKSQILLYTAAAVAMLFLLFIWISVDMGRLPGFITALYDFPHGDKVGHFLLMGLITFLILLPFCAGSEKNRTKRMLIVGGAIFIIITAEEFGQSLFANRTMDIIDLLCSYAGIGVSFLLAMTACRKNKI